MEIDLELILPQLPGFIALHDLEGRLIWSNKLSYGFDQSLFGTMSDLNIVSDDRSRWWDWFRRAAMNREISDYSVRIIVPAKPGWAKIQGRLAPVIKNGEVIYVSAFTYDATFHPDTDPKAKFMLSELERAIVVALLGSTKPLKSSAIASRVGETKNSSGLRVILANLSDRGILAASSTGYAIAEQFRTFAVDLIR